MSTENEIALASCCVVGGGPAGIMVGYLLARAGVDVVVLEKHRNFLHDFRGDTIHPSTLELFHELGLLDQFLRLPHQEVTELEGEVGDEKVTIADFKHLPTHCRFLALMPQSEFLGFVVKQAKRHPNFRLMMQTEVTDLIEEGGQVRGVRAETPTGVMHVRSDLTIATDGRHSAIRECAGLEVMDQGAPMDVMWFRLPRYPHDSANTFAHVESGKILVLLNRGNFWQCAFVVPKNTIEEIGKQGIASLRDQVAHLAPFLSNRVRVLADWQQVRVLSVAVDRLREWARPGLLCIGDAAHAMSPIGGVGINLAIQDAVATANLLGDKILHRSVTFDDLRAVQRRRQFPVRLTQWLQVFLQNRVIRRVLNSRTRLTLPWMLRLLQAWPVLRRIPARLIGIGVRPEHVPQLASSMTADSAAETEIPSRSVMRQRSDSSRGASSSATA